MLWLHQIKLTKDKVPEGNCLSRRWYFPFFIILSFDGSIFNIYLLFPRRYKWLGWNLVKSFLLNLRTMECEVPKTKKEPIKIYWYHICWQSVKVSQSLSLSYLLSLSFFKFIKILYIQFKKHRSIQSLFFLTFMEYIKYV